MDGQVSKEAMIIFVVGLTALWYYYEIVLGGRRATRERREKLRRNTGKL